MRVPYLPQHPAISYLGGAGMTPYTAALLHRAQGINLAARWMTRTEAASLLREFSFLAVSGGAITRSPGFNLMVRGKQYGETVSYLEVLRLIRANFSRRRHHCPACTHYGSNPKDCICRYGTKLR